MDVETIAKKVKLARECVYPGNYLTLEEMEFLLAEIERLNGIPRVQGKVQE